MMDPEASKIALTANFPTISKYTLFQDLTALTTVVAVVGNGANTVSPTQSFWDEVYQVKTPYTETMYKYYGTGFPFWDELAMFSILDPSNVLNSTWCMLFSLLLHELMLTT